MKLEIDSKDSLTLLHGARALLNIMVIESNPANAEMMETVKSEPTEYPPYPEDVEQMQGLRPITSITGTDDNAVAVIHPEDVETMRDIEAQTNPPVNETPTITITDEGQGTEPVTRDKAGIEWDERIHSKAKEPLNKAGLWKRRKNIDDATYQSVLAELSAKTPTPEQVFEAPPPVMLGAEMPPPTTGLDPALVAQFDAGCNDEPGSVQYIKLYKEWRDNGYPSLAAPEIPVVVPLDAELTWGDVFNRCLAAVSSQHITNEQLNAKAIEYGVGGGFAVMGNRPDLFEKLLIELSIP